MSVDETGTGEQLSLVELRSAHQGRLRRRFWRRVSFLAVCVVVLVAAFTYLLSYQPLKLGGWTSSRPGMATLTDGVDETTGYLVTAAPGGHGGFEMLITNTGHFPVTITGVDTVLTTVRWAKETGNLFDVPPVTHALPVTVPAGGELVLELNIKKPLHCKTEESLGGLLLSTRTLGLTHTVDFGFPAPMNVCAPASFDQGTLPPDTGGSVLVGVG